MIHDHRSCIASPDRDSAGAVADDQQFDRSLTAHPDGTRSKSQRKAVEQALFVNVNVRDVEWCDRVLVAIVWNKPPIDAERTWAEGIVGHEVEHRWA